MTIYTNNDDTSDESGDGDLPRSAKRKRSRNIFTQQEIEIEVAEVFVDKNTLANITT